MNGADGLNGLNGPANGNGNGSLLGKLVPLLPLALRSPRMQAAALGIAAVYSLATAPVAPLAQGLAIAVVGLITAVYLGTEGRRGGVAEAPGVNPPKAGPAPAQEGKPMD